MFTLKAFYKVDVPFFFENWFYWIWAVFAGSFVFISGIVCRYSANNIKRGAQCFLLGMVLTFVTALAAPPVAILFGILHFLGICMLLFGLGEELFDFIPPYVGLIVSVVLLAFTWNVPNGYLGTGSISFELPQLLYKAKLLFPLGFKGAGFSSGDYFPMLPWVFLFFAGVYFGIFVKEGDCPRFFYATRIPLLAAVGRYTIWIYLFHQPLAILILFFILGKPDFNYK